MSNHFDYLKHAATKFGRFYLVRDFESFVDTITEDQLGELRAVHSLIEAKQDSAPISRWIDDSFARRGKIPKRDSDFSAQVGQMFRLFDYLGRRGIQPFSSGTVAYLETPRTPNWKNLPLEMHYLIQAAEKYGVYSSEMEILDFLERAGPENLETLARVAEIIRLNNHWIAIDQWIIDHPMDTHEESAMVYWLQAVLAYAGLDSEGGN